MSVVPHTKAIEGPAICTHARLFPAAMSAAVTLRVQMPIFRLVWVDDGMIMASGQALAVANPTAPPLQAEVATGSVIFTGWPAPAVDPLTSPLTLPAPARAVGTTQPMKMLPSSEV